MAQSRAPSVSPHGVRGLQIDRRTKRQVHVPYADQLHPRVLYEAQSPGSVAAATIFEDDPPTGSRPGTVFTTSQPLRIIQVRYGNVWMKRVASSPSGDEFTYSGTTITMGQTVNAGEDFYAWGSI